MARPKEIQKPRAKPTWIEAGEKKPRNRRPPPRNVSE